MKLTRFIPVALVMAAGLTIAACSSGTSAPASAPSTPTTSATSSPMTAYLTDLENHGGDFSNLSVGVAETEGNGACEDFKAGGTVASTVQDGETAIAENPSWGLTDSDIGYLIGAAVDYLCPQFRATVLQQLQAQGYGTG